MVGPDVGTVEVNNNESRFSVNATKAVKGHGRPQPGALVVGVSPCWNHTHGRIWVETELLSQGKSSSIISGEYAMKEAVKALD